MATEGVDYDNTPTFSNGVTLNADGTITVPAGVTDFTVTYPTLDDNLADDGETTTVTVDTATVPVRSMTKTALILATLLKG